MLSTKLKEAAGNGADATLYVDDVFSTYLYTGTGATQTITNGIDLAGKGGMVWIKARNDSGSSNLLFDTARGAGTRVSSNQDNPAFSTLPYGLTAFGATGFTVADDSIGSNAVNGPPGGTYSGNGTYASWTFREAAKFFDVVTYTGTGSARTIAHSLGVAPGMIFVKRTDVSANWQVYHRSLTSAANSIQLNLNAAQASAPTVWNSTAPTSSVFSVGTDATVNASGGTYVAYLYAHDTSSTGIIQCGSFTKTAGVDVNVALGWEPQYLFVKTSNNTKNWEVYDSMRGFCAGNTGVSAFLNPNLSAAESSNSYLFGPTATGFSGYGNLSAATYIYMAIRRPNKPPTTGTQVYIPTAYAGDGSASRVVGSLSAIDTSFITARNSVHNNTLQSRLIGSFKTLTEASDAESAASVYFDQQTGVRIGNGTSYYNNASGYNYVTWNFARAPGFFDEVCYTGTGTGTGRTNHNLTVVPELIITKCRGASNNWVVYSATLGFSKYLLLNATNAQITGSPYTYTSTTEYSMPSDVDTTTYVSYLFATLAGISKVGSYTGNGTGQAIACGFSAGARFVLIKRTDSTGNWYTFDSARGLTSGSSPYLLLNSTAAEVTGNNGVYASTGGFTLGATAITTTNIATATYIFLAVS